MADRPRDDNRSASPQRGSPIKRTRVRGVLVVGGAGYVGSILCRELQARNFRVRVLDRLDFGDSRTTPTAGGVDLVVADMRDPPPQAFEHIDVCVNLGGLSNDPMAELDPEETYELNTRAAIRLAELCRSRGVQQYVLASTASIYNRGTDEDLDGPLDELAYVAPQAPYAVSKLEAEKGILALAEPRFHPVVLRMATVFGYSPRMRYDLVINAFVKDALRIGTITLIRGGEVWRPVVDIRDAAKAYALTLEAPLEAISSQIFNIASGNYRVSELGLRVRQVLSDLSIQTDLRCDYTEVPVRNYRVRTTKATQVLGWTPGVSLAEGVRDMVLDIRSNAATDFENPRYYNIQWMHILRNAKRRAQ
jgi:nucleoside-diphosphate-sugar epimerase